MNKETEKMILSILVGISIGIFMNIVFAQFEEEPEFNFAPFLPSEPPQFDIADINMTVPVGIIFYADYLKFEDGHMTVGFDGKDHIKIFNESITLESFDNFSYIEWNIGNESWTYVKEVNDEP